jgi:hypothetical protein
MDIASCSLAVEVGQTVSVDAVITGVKSGGTCDVQASIYWFLDPDDGSIDGADVTVLLEDGARQIVISGFRTFIVAGTYEFRIDINDPLTLGAFTIAPMGAVIKAVAY